MMPNPIVGPAKVTIRFTESQERGRRGLSNETRRMRVHERNAWMLRSLLEK